MTTLEKTYDLYSPAPGGGVRKTGEVRAIVSRLTASETEQSDTVSLRESSVACVLRQSAPAGGFVRGMRLRRRDRVYAVESAIECSRLWILRLSRTLMDGEA